MHEHAYSQNHAHHHGSGTAVSHRLWIALLINGVFLVAEVIGGIMTNSLALLADAGHMLTDVAALILALVVTSLARSSPTPRRTFGLLRAEVLGAFINGAALMVVVVVILREAWRRISAPPDVDAPLMLLIAVLGLAANLGSAAVLYRHREENVNMKGAFLHMAADALGSIGAITAGALIWFAGWTLADPVVSVFIGVLILWGSWGLLTETVNILLEATPGHIDYSEVEQALLDIEHVTGIHDLHIWTITSGVPSLSAHVTLEPSCSDSNHWHRCLKQAQTMLLERFDIEHSTLQFEPADYERDGRWI